MMMEEKDGNVIRTRTIRDGKEKSDWQIMKKTSFNILTVLSYKFTATLMKLQTHHSESP